MLQSIQYFSNFLIMHLYLALLFLFLKIPLPSYFLRMSSQVFLDGVFVPGFMSISKAIILSSSGDQRHLVRAASCQACEFPALSLQRQSPVAPPPLCSPPLPHHDSPPLRFWQPPVSLPVGASCQACDFPAPLFSLPSAFSGAVGRLTTPQYFYNAPQDQRYRDRCPIKSTPKGNTVPVKKKLKYRTVAVPYLRRT